MNTPFDARAYAPILHNELPYPLLFSSIGGAHMFGFPSPDSDVDLRACHILPTTSFISLDEPRLTVNRIWLVDGVEVDLVSHDLKKFATLLLRQSGNHLEQLFSPLVVEEHDSMLLSLQQQLQDAFETSPLPEMPTNRAALDDFIVRVRLACA